MSLPATMDESSSGLLAHLKARDTTYVRVSRAPYPTLAAAKAAHGRTFPPQLHLTPEAHDMVPHHAYQILEAERPKTDSERRAADRRLGEMAQTMAQVLDNLTRWARGARTAQPVSSQDYDGQGEISGLPPMPVGSGVSAADRPAHQPA